MNRRDFLEAAAGMTMSAGGILLPESSLAQAIEKDLEFDLTKGARTVNLYRPETGESLNLTYMRDGVWQGSSYQRLCWFMRDIHIGRAVTMDYNLIAILDWTQRYLAKYGYTQAIHLLSAYRSRLTNGKTEGAAKDSLHMYGKALDVRIPGLSAEYLGNLFRWLAQGGVGYYSHRGFTHLDTGAVRAWRG